MLKGLVTLGPSALPAAAAPRGKTSEYSVNNGRALSRTSPLEVLTKQPRSSRTIFRYTMKQQNKCPTEKKHTSNSVVVKHKAEGSLAMKGRCGSDARSRLPLSTRAGRRL